MWLTRHTSSDFKGLQSLRQRRGAGRAVFGSLGKTGHHHGLERWRNRLVGELRRGHRWMLQVLEDGLQGCIAFENEVAGEQVICDAAERVEIGAPVYGSVVRHR